MFEGGEKRCPQNINLPFIASRTSGGCYLSGRQKKEKILFGSGLAVIGSEVLESKNDERNFNAKGWRR